MSAAPGPPELILDCSWSGTTARATIEGPTVAGRAAGVGLVIPLEDASRQHARIEPVGSQWRIVDLGSLNGTHVNGARIAAPAVLQDGDVIHIGGGALRVKFKVPVVDLETMAEQGTMIVAAKPVSEVLGVVAGAQTLMGPLPTGNWALGLARDAAEALLLNDNLSKALGALLSQAAGYLPGERGLIALLDDAGELTPSASFGFEGTPRVSREVVKRVVQGREAIVIEEVGSGDAASAQQTLIHSQVRSLAAAPLYHHNKVRGLIYLDARTGKRKFKAEDLEVLGAIGLFAAIGIEQKLARDRITEQDKVRARLERYSSPQVVERIIQPTMQASMIAEEKVVTVLFADLCGFTALSEGMSPAHVAMLLNSLFDQLTAEVFRQGGTLDKFMGDGMMAFFGAPAPLEGHEAKAVRAAWEMRQALERLNKEFHLAKPVRIRYGINTGPVVVGDIGSQQRRDYTVIGDTVNVASRLEGQAQPDQVVVGAATWEGARDAFDFEALEPVKVKNRQEPVKLYRVVGPR